MTSDVPAGLPEDLHADWKDAVYWSHLAANSSACRTLQILARFAAAEARAVEAERRLRELALKLFPFGCASCQEFHDRIIAALAATEADHAG